MINIKTFTLALGVILLGVGIAGALQGGHDHHLIVFGVNMNHNIVHIVSGVAAIAAALAGPSPAKGYCLVFGAVYGVVTVAGFLGLESVVSMLNLNTADNFLHLGITAACLYFGLTAKSA